MHSSKSERSPRVAQERIAREMNKGFGCHPFSSPFCCCPWPVLQVWSRSWGWAWSRTLYSWSFLCWVVWVISVRTFDWWPHTVLLPLYALCLLRWDLVWKYTKKTTREGNRKIHLHLSQWRCFFQFVHQAQFGGWEKIVICPLLIKTDNFDLNVKLFMFREEKFQNLWKVVGANPATDSQTRIPQRKNVCFSFLYNLWRPRQ